MKNTCMKWKDQLLEAALGEPEGSELRAHLLQCPDCSAQLQGLRARRERLDTLLPLVASAAEPSPDLRARILAATETSAARRRPHVWRVWALAGATTVIVIAAIIAWAFKSRTDLTEAELHQAQALAQWRSPTDVLLRIPGQEFLNATPKLGESYIKVPIVSKQEEIK